jgi:hypothetical protein
MPRAQQRARWLWPCCVAVVVTCPGTWGCLVLPPAHLRGGLGEQGGQTAAEVQGGFDPLQLVKPGGEAPTRRASLEIGVVGRRTPLPAIDRPGGIGPSDKAPTSTNGVFFEAGAFPFLWRDGGDWVTRAGIAAQVRGEFDAASGAQGWGGSLQLLLERATFADSSTPHDGAYGEGAIGGYLSVGYDDVDGAWVATAGLSVRIPSYHDFPRLSGGTCPGCCCRCR